MRIEGIDEDIRARLPKTLARFPHIEEIQVTEGLLERLLGNHFGSHLGHLPGHRIYVRTVNLGQPWRKIEERVKEIVKEGDEEAGDDGGQTSAETMENAAALTSEKKAAALRCGVSQGVMQVCWDAAGEVIKAWSTEGHSVAIPGLGTMRFGVRAKSVATVGEVAGSLITTRRVIFTPNVDIKDELQRTPIQITCIDRNGKVVKNVTSGDGGNVEDPDKDPNGGGTSGGSGNTEGGSGNTEGGSGNTEGGGSMGL